MQEITSLLPTLTESGLPLAEMQALYRFLGLDPDDLFSPKFGEPWQARSTRFQTGTSAMVAAISSNACNADAIEMTVATFRSCQAGGEPDTGGE